MRVLASFVLSVTLLSVRLEHADAQTSSQAAASAAAAASPQPQLSPRAAYDDALHPLDITRHNIANWSDIEIAAMRVSIARGKAECAARSVEKFSGPDLLDLAHLCSLGQQWPAVAGAAALYINEPRAPKPLLADAYANKVDAELRMKDEASALIDVQTMLASVPYQPTVAETVDEALDYMRFMHTADAITLANARQPYLLTGMHAGQPSAAATPGSGAEGNTARTDTAAAAPSEPKAAIPMHQLYSEGLQLATLYQLQAKPDMAAAALAALEAALPATLAPDDALPIAAERRRYALLGKPLAGITPLASLSSPVEQLPALPALHTETAMFLFPDWCAACVRMGPRLPETVVSVEGHAAYMYALLVETVPSRKPDPHAANAGFEPAFARASLAETPTVVVAPAALDRFAATDFPFLIITDANGMVRVLQPVGADDLQPGGSVDAAIALVGKTFPPLLPQKASGGAASPTSGATSGTRKGEINAKRMP